MTFNPAGMDLRPCPAPTVAARLVPEDNRWRFITHHFSLDDFEAAYDVFARAAATGALNVVLSRYGNRKARVTTMKTTVKEVMTTQVMTVRRDATFKEMAATLRQYRVSAFPVIGDDGKVIGVVSEADMLAKEVLNGEHAGTLTAMLHRRERDKADGLTAGELMTHPAVTVASEDTVEHAARLMYTLRVKRLPVIDAGCRLVGIISRTDVLAVFDRLDDEIRAEITDNVILHDFLVDPRQFVVTVQAGVVTLEGSPQTASLGHHLVRKVRHVQGVVAVRDRLGYPDDYPLVAGPVF